MRFTDTQKEILIHTTATSKLSARDLGFNLGIFSGPAPRSKSATNTTGLRKNEAGQMIPKTTTNSQLTREEILWILRGIPEDPEALSHIDVKHLINGACKLHATDFPECERIFDWLLETGWMVPATELNAIRSGSDHYFYRRSDRGSVAFHSRLIERKPKWV